MLHVDAGALINKQGVLLTPMSSVERQGIVGPAHGLLVFQIDGPAEDRTFWYYDAVIPQWKKIGDPNSGAQEWLVFTTHGF